MPKLLLDSMHSRLGSFLTLLVLVNGLSAALLSLIYAKTPVSSLAEAELLAMTLWKVFFILIIVTGVFCWLFVLAQASRLVAEEESQRQTRRLTEEIAAHERTDKALQEAKENAEAANGAKSRYLTGISHELRSPLNAILGYAQLMENDDSVPPHRREALGVIRRSGLYLADLIEGLLDISKIEAGRLDLRRDRVRIGMLMEQVVTMFRLQAEEKGLAFNYYCPNPLPDIVTTDEKRLRQILINLLSNAIKYTDRGSVTLTLKYRSQVAEFTVEDTGEGISPENADRIFRPFERIRTPGQSRVGTGLGLTITRLLTENPAFADIPIIFMTGLSDTEHVVMGLKAGGVDYVTKPINTAELLARMDVHLANARMSRSARSALDSAGQNLFAVDHEGNLLWGTPQVCERLPDTSHPDFQVIRTRLAEWINRSPEPGHSMPLQALDIQHSIEYLTLVDGREYLLRLKTPQSQSCATAALRERFQLTLRESDVLLWIANGKTNREIAQILDMSPRTVNKHLEQVFRKLGVENRTSAAASAIRLLAAQ
nr:ATP-binding protein [Marinobacter sp. ANT_B65]